jgi:LysR family transcriptional regulator, low CO2-responsive transcriptional regulator
MSIRHATLRQLKVFEAVARHLSFSRAADELHLTQPAVSMQVKALETQAGLPLFEQVGKRIHLTEAGEALQRHGRTIGDELRAAEETLDGLRGLQHGRLAIAAVSTATYVAPPLLARFIGAHPGVALRLAVDNRAEVLRQLADNEVDLAMIGRPPENLEITAEAFAQHPHVVIASPQHPLAGRRRVRLERLATETFIVREPGSGTRGLLERLFVSHGLSLNVSMEMASNESIKQAVLAGMGVSLLSLHTVGLELETGRLVTLDVVGLPVVRQWHIAHLARKRLSPVALACKRFLLQEAAAFLADRQSQPRKTRRKARTL